MSKIGQEVFEAQEFATENYNIARDDLVKLSNKVFSGRPFTIKTAIEEFDVIQKDMVDWEKYSIGDI